MESQLKCFQCEFSEENGERKTLIIIVSGIRFFRKNNYQEKQKVDQENSVCEFK